MVKSSLGLICIMLLLCACTSRTAAQPGNTNPPEPLQYKQPFNNVPAREDVSIYQVNMRAFSKEGNFQGVIARLDSIKALGINVVYLMPVYPVGIVKGVNSPYCVRDYYGINPEFGTLDGLRNLIDGAHNRQMAVILDWVPNHSSFDNPWTSKKSWYLQDSTGNIISPPGTGWNDVAQLNYKNTDMRSAMIRAMKYWILTTNADGFRCDYSDGPPADFWKEAIDTLRSISSHKLLLLAEGSRNANYAAGFDFNFGFRFFEELKLVYEKDKTARAFDTLNRSDYAGATPGQAVVRYTSNHDVNGSDGTPQQLFGGERGAISAFILAAYMKSVPMIYNGQEVGTPYKLTFPFTSTRIDWTPKPAITNEYKKILLIRNNSAAIRKGMLTSYSSDNVCSFLKQYGKEKVVVIVNLRNKPEEFELPKEIQHSSWTNAMNNATVKLTKQVQLEPYSYLILKNQSTQ